MPDLDKDQETLLLKAFEAFDTEKKGWIATQMVGTILDMLGQTMSPSQVEAIITEIDTEVSQVMKTLHGFECFQSRIFSRNPLESSSLVDESYIIGTIHLMIDSRIRSCNHMLHSLTNVWREFGLKNMLGTFIRLGLMLLTIICTGQMNFEMFCVLASKFLGEKPENEVLLHKELMEAFRFYDKEGNGYITLEVLREILLELDPNLSEMELTGMMEEIDSDGSGTIDFEEFKAMMTGD